MTTYRKSYYQRRVEEREKIRNAIKQYKSGKSWKEINATQAENVQAENVQAENVQAENVQAENVQAENVQDKKNVKKNLQAESVEQVEKPNKNWKKTHIQKYLSANGIHWDESMTKSELLRLVKELGD